MRRSKLPMLVTVTLTVILGFVGFVIVIGVLMFAAYWPLSESNNDAIVNRKFKVTSVSLRVDSQFDTQSIAIDSKKDILFSYTKYGEPETKDKKQISQIEYIGIERELQSADFYTMKSSPQKEGDAEDLKNYYITVETNEPKIYLVSCYALNCDEKFINIANRINLAWNKEAKLISK